MQLLNNIQATIQTRALCNQPRLCRNILSCTKRIVQMGEVKDKMWSIIKQLFAALLTCVQQAKHTLTVCKSAHREGGVKCNGLTHRHHRSNFFHTVSILKGKK
jgi:hypothetical protein